MSDFTNIENIISDARNGKMYILVDSEDRENEGDLIIPLNINLQIYKLYPVHIDKRILI